MGTRESSPWPVPLQWEPGPAAVPSCSLSASPFLLLPQMTQSSEDAEPQPAKAFPGQEWLHSALLAASVKKQEFEEAQTLSPSLPPVTAGDQPSQAEVGAARPPAHTVATAVSPASANMVLHAFP